MCVKKRLFTAILFGFSFLVCSQNFENLYQKLDKDILIFNSSTIIKQVDSLLLNSKLSEHEISELKSLKGEAFCQIAAFPKALEISDEVFFSNTSFSQRAEVRLRVVRALVFEVSNLPKETLNELDILDSIYKLRKKDRHYGKYLYRKSSYYRIFKPVEKSDSLAKFYAVKAAVFGDKNKYYDVSSIGKMLQGFLVPRNQFEKRMEFMKASIQDLKLVNDQRSMILMYNGLVNSYQQNKNIEVAKKYLDSSLALVSDVNDLYLKTVVFRQKSSFFENLNQNDSALFYFKKFHEVELEMNMEKQNLRVAEINFNNQIEAKNSAIFEANEKLEETKNNNLFLISILLGILMLLTIIFIQNRKITRKNKDIFTKNNTLTKNLEEKKVLLKELNHRVKNNLSLIISLIKFQVQEINDTFYLEKFHNLENRISTIAIAHEQFIYSEDNIEGKFYNLKEYLNKISNSLIQLSPKKISYHQKVKENASNLGIFIIESMVSQLEGSLNRKGSSYIIKLKKK